MGCPSLVVDDFHVFGASVGTVDVTRAGNVDATGGFDVVCTGGTGLTGRDVTPEAVDRVKDKAIEGFGELFRMLSFAEIGSAAMT